jgi:hypothetical protein
MFGDQAGAGRFRRIGMSAVGNQRALPFGPNGGVFDHVAGSIVEAPVDLPTQERRVPKVVDGSGRVADMAWSIASRPYIG